MPTASTSPIFILPRGILPPPVNSLCSFAIDKDKKSFLGKSKPFGEVADFDPRMCDPVRFYRLSRKVKKDRNNDIEAEVTLGQIGLNHKPSGRLSALSYSHLTGTSQCIPRQRSQMKLGFSAWRPDPKSVRIALLICHTYSRYGYFAIKPLELLLIWGGKLSLSTHAAKYRSVR